VGKHDDDDEDDDNDDDDDDNNDDNDGGGYQDIAYKIMMLAMITVMIMMTNRHS